MSKKWLGNSVKYPARCQKIGLFGGTFDPIHFAHLNLAMELKEKCGLDAVWFIPARVNPLKYGDLPPVSSEHRLAMLKLALQNYPDFFIRDLELKREAPSFTVETIRTFLKEGSQWGESLKFYWLMGEDSLYTFEKWHRFEEILELVPLLIGTRSIEQSLKINLCNSKLKKVVKEGLIKTHLLDISATEIRKRLSLGLNCYHLIPYQVITYIKQNRLYELI